MSEQRGAANLPLRGIRILDFSRVIAGPFCTMLLGDLGAEVIKVEPPEGGDEARQLGSQMVNGESPAFLAFNHNKKSVAIDARTAAGRELCRRLGAQCDVLIENFRPGVMARLGLDYESLRAVNPGLVYCSISGFGADGPMGGEPGYDPIVQALTGILKFTGGPGSVPSRTGPPVIDMGAGMLAAISIASALYRRRETGEGCYVDAALLDIGCAYTALQQATYTLTGKLPRQVGARGQYSAPCDVFPTATQEIIVYVLSQKNWLAFCEATGLEHLLQEERFATNPKRVEHEDELGAIVSEQLRTRPASEWLEQLRAAGVVCGPVNTVADLVDLPQAKHRKLQVRLKHPTVGEVELPGRVLKIGDITDEPLPEPPPLLGQHTGEVLRELLGVTETELVGLASQGVVRQ